MEEKWMIMMDFLTVHATPISTIERFSAQKIVVKESEKETD